MSGGHQYLERLTLGGTLQNPIHKYPVRVATTGSNIVLAGGAPNMLDGEALAQGDRVLVKDQSNGAENLIHEIAVLGTGSNGTWVRARDMNKNYEVTAGTLVVVQQGVLHGKALFEQTTYGPILLGVTPLAWFKYAAGTTVGSELIEVPFTFSSGIVILKPLQPGDIVSPCYVRITTAWDVAGATLSIGTPSAPNALLAPSDVNLYTLGRYDAGLDFQASVSENLLLTIGGPSTTGAGYALFSVG